MPLVSDNAEDTCLNNHLDSRTQQISIVNQAPHQEVEKCTHPVDNIENVLPPRNTSHDFEYPDGGLKAWLVVFGSFCSMGVIYGLINTSAVFESYFKTHQLSDYTHSEIGWIFSLYLFIVFFAGVQVGPLFDRYGPRMLVAVGTSCVVASLMLLSISKSESIFA